MYRARSALRHGQMSEAFSTMVFLTLSGGLQDAYTYCVRGQVFANAQTGRCRHRNRITDSQIIELIHICHHFVKIVYFVYYKNNRLMASS